MERYLNALKRHVSGMDAQLPTARFATVQSYNPATHTAKVRIQPEGTLTGWLPICTNMTANGWGIVAPPTIGGQVFLVPQEGDQNSYVIMGSVFSQANKVPVPGAAIAGAATSVKPGEIALISANGNVVIRLGGDGTLYIKSSSQVNVETATANVKASTQANVDTPLCHMTGNLVVDGEISDHAGSRGTLAGLRTNYDTHRHPGIQGGNGTTGTTTLPIGS